MGADYVGRGGTARVRVMGCRTPNIDRIAREGG